MCTVSRTLWSSRGTFSSSLRILTVAFFNTWNAELSYSLLSHLNNLCFSQTTEKTQPGGHLCTWDPSVIMCGLLDGSQSRFTEVIIYMWSSDFSSATSRFTPQIFREMFLQRFKFGKDVYFSRRMNCFLLADAFHFHVAPSSGIFGIMTTCLIY